MRPHPPASSPENRRRGETKDQSHKIQTGRARKAKPAPEGIHPGGIGTLQENSLHAELKRWYAKPGDLLESRVDGYVIDIVRGELLIEIQTRNFSMIKKKLVRLLEQHPVRLVYPVAAERWIIKQDAAGQALGGRRKSPRRGRLEHLFGELLRLPELVSHPNFSLEVIMVQEEELRRDDGKGSWRRKGVSIQDRRLLKVLTSRTFDTPADLAALLPEDLPALFAVRDLARLAHLPVPLARKMAYCLRQMGAIYLAGKKGRANLYSRLKTE